MSYSDHLGSVVRASTSMQFTNTYSKLYQLVYFTHYNNIFKIYPVFVFVKKRKEEQK